MHQDRGVPSAPAARDYGPEPLIINITCAARQNPFYRAPLWTGRDLQVTLMSIPPRSDVGLEVHTDLDQFIRIESGCALVQMGKTDTQLNCCQQVGEHHAILIPAGTWHNLTNTGNVPVTLFSIYAPPQHPFGTVHETKEEAEKTDHR